MTQKQLIPVLGVDFGGTSIKAAVCCGSVPPEEIISIDTAQFEGPTPTLDAIAALALQAKRDHPDLAAIGIGVPGMVNFDEGVVYDLTNVPGWKNVHARAYLEQRTGIPVFLDNDANAMTYAEWKYGAGQPYRSIVALTLGTGVGGGLVINDQMHRGASFCAGEIGQMSIDYKGRNGYYGNFGALERYVGNGQISDYALELYAAAGLSRTPATCTPRDLAALAHGGDRIALDVWEDFGTWLGSALADVIWLLNPDAIIVGGGIAKAGDLIFRPLKARLKQMLSDVLYDNAKILPAHFSDKAGIIGNAAMALDMVEARSI